ncbi:glycerate kinase [Staphylococcus shinii]|uniref:glycerate kinase n=1 Tax=Staphylococcus shinii TaxID=2912228 RepID=UPI000D1E157C|nr:glycerate kinase [Staphylococcus shinii]PTI65073.1 glycerate kinase [Staphylococcus shinii]
MNILIAPDSFKESLSAMEISIAIEKGIKTVNPSIDTLNIPLADGGEGTIEAIIDATQGNTFTVNTVDALGRKTLAKYGITGDNKTAIIELASASGIDKIKKQELDPSNASTYGTGILIKYAIQKGIREFIICLGGSATNDGGTGLLKALGFKFKDKQGNLINEGGLSLKNLYEIDDSETLEELKDCQFNIACDVTNPFVGSKGASTIFGPQKGASPCLVQELDHALNHFANIIQKKYHVRVHDIEGAGAAGGTSGGLYGCLNAQIYSGFDLIASTLNLNKILSDNNIDLIITGEGQLDSQTENGKVISGISHLGDSYHIPTIALVGGIQNISETLYKRGLIAVFSIVNQPMSLSKSMDFAADLITKQTEQVMRLYLSKL